MNNPCKTCTKRNPRTCSGAYCPEYRKWFVEKWNRNRLIVLEALTKKEERSDG